MKNRLRSSSEISLTGLFVGKEELIMICLTRMMTWRPDGEGSNESLRGCAKHYWKMKSSARLVSITYS